MKLLEVYTCFDCIYFDMKNVYCKKSKRKVPSKNDIVYKDEINKELCQCLPDWCTLSNPLVHNIEETVITDVYSCYKCPDFVETSYGAPFCKACDKEIPYKEVTCSGSREVQLIIAEKFPEWCPLEEIMYRIHKT